MHPVVTVWWTSDKGDIWWYCNFETHCIFETAGLFTLQVFDD
jgi:hypothetical protein